MFRSKRAVGIELARSAYLDRNGQFVKCETDLHVINVTFADGDVMELTAAEYARLSTTEQDAVKNAGVSVRVLDNPDREDS
jgi:hypothetical protein